MVPQINIIGEQMEYLSYDYIEKSKTIDSWHFQSITTEFLNFTKHIWFAKSSYQAKNRQSYNVAKKLRPNARAL